MIEQRPGEAATDDVASIAATEPTASSAGTASTPAARPQRNRRRRRRSPTSAAVAFNHKHPILIVVNANLIIVSAAGNETKKVAPSEIMNDFVQPQECLQITDAVGGVIVRVSLDAKAIGAVRAPAAGVTDGHIACEDAQIDVSAQFVLAVFAVRGDSGAFARTTAAW